MVPVGCEVCGAVRAAAHSMAEKASLVWAVALGVAPFFADVAVEFHVFLLFNLIVHLLRTREFEASNSHRSRGCRMWCGGEVWVKGRVWVVGVSGGGRRRGGRRRCVSLLGEL